MINNSELGSQRSRRENAGNRLRKLLDEELEEEKLFEEDENDEDFVNDGSSEDIVDSDFDINEEEEGEGAEGEIEEEKTRQQGMLAKPKKAKFSFLGKHSHKEKKSILKESKSNTKKKSLSILKRKSERHSTIQQSRECDEKQNLQTSMGSELDRTPVRSAKVKRKIISVPSQSQLLEEAKITEKRNIELLLEYQKREVEKKKIPKKQAVLVGPRMRYHSKIEASMSSVDGPSKKEKSDTKPSCISTLSYYNFTDANSLCQFPVSSELRRSPKKRNTNCLVTGLPAIYQEPLTRIPYACHEVCTLICKKIRKHSKAFSFGDQQTEDDGVKVEGVVLAMKRYLTKL